MAKRRQHERTIPRGYGRVVQRGARFHARWKTWDANGFETEHAKSFGTFDEAEDFLRVIGRQRRDGTYVEPDRRTVEQLIEEWLARGESGWSPNSYNTYRRKAERHVYPGLGALLAVELTTPRVQHWIDTLVKQFSASTVESALYPLRAACTEAVRLGVLTVNPASGVKVPTARPNPRVTWSGADVATVLQHLADDPFWSAIYHVATTTGVRPGELRSLRWIDYDRIDRTIRVTRTMTRSREGAIVVGGTTKGKRDRIIAVTTQTAAALNRWRTFQLEQNVASGIRHDTDFIFAIDAGTPLPQVTWQRKHAAIIRETGVPAITPHGTRHTAATLLLRAGVNPKIVSEMLGHSSVQITLDIYSHVDLDMQRTAASAIEAAIFGEKAG